MGWIQNLREGIFRVRIVPKDDASDNTSFTNKRDSVTNRIDDAIEAGKRIDLTDLMNITTLKGTRNQKYTIFEEMVADGRIGAAVEMYANDTVQYNQEGKVIWVESDNTDVAKYANKLLEDLNIAENLWSYAYCMWLYGDVYLELFQNTSTSGKKPTLLVEPIRQGGIVGIQKDIEGAYLEKYVEKVSNPADIYDLQFKGKTSGFVRSPESIDGAFQNNTYQYQGLMNELDILNPTKYVHICLSPNINRFPEKFNLIKEPVSREPDDRGLVDKSDTESSGKDSLSFTVKTGQSILENVYGPYQTLKLKEDSVLLERVTKSSITRVIQVELGDMPESQKKKKLQEIKNQIEQQLIMNKESGSLQSRPGSQPIENIIYTTTKNNKGTISTVNIGGDAEIGNIEDVTASENKVYGSLLTPKAALGADMDGTGLSNGGSLTELNTTYARRIKRGQVAISSGITTLINIFALSEGLKDHVNNFTVHLTPIITVEDKRRDELLRDKVQNVRDILDIIDKVNSEETDEEGNALPIAVNQQVKLEMIVSWLSNYLNQQDIVDILNERIKELEKLEKNKESNEAIKDHNAEFDNDLGGDGGGIDIDIDNELPGPSSFDETEEVIKEPDLQQSEEVNLSEIEGEDLV